MEINKIYNEDCIEGMKQIPSKSIDCIICDLPYGVLNKGNVHSKWDKPLFLPALWDSYERIIKDRGAIILFGQGVFTAELIISNRRLFRYNLVWKKGDRCTGFLNANRMPLRNHEDICVYYKKLPVYNPIMRKGYPNHTRGHGGGTNRIYGTFDNQKNTKTKSTEKFPLSVIDIPKEHAKWLHPTQKPVAIIEYLINTYTNEGDLLLDNCMGSGTTAVACINTNRRYIGFELNKKYYDISIDRIESMKGNEIKMV